MNTSYDVIVIGLGAMGSAATYQLAKRGVRVLGIDQYAPPHTLGSTHGESRITRLAVGEGAAYMPLVQRTHEIWHELEAITGNKLFHQSGGYIICPEQNSDGWHGDGDFVLRTVDLANQYGIEHEHLQSAELAARAPLLKLLPNEHAIFEPSAGTVSPEGAVSAQLQLAKRLGAELRLDEKVLSYVADKDGVTVSTAQGQYSAEKIIISAGPWISDIVPEVFKQPLGVYRQVFHWFEADDISAFAPERFPWLLWIAEKQADYFGVFPTHAGATPAVKMLTEQFIDADHPDSVDRHVHPEEIAYMHDHFIANRLHGVSDRSIGASVCLYTVTADEHFIIDWHPDSERVLVASPCSGHGFKHSAAIGESLAQMMSDGESTIDMGFFGFGRFT